MPLTIAELETPIPVVDLDRLARNLDRAAEYATAHGLLHTSSQGFLELFQYV